MKKGSKETALSAIACAFSTIALTVGTLYSPLLFTGYLAACFCMMLPLSRGYYKGAALCFVASNVLTLLFNGFNFFDTLPYTAFFGLHPVVNEIQIAVRRKRTEKKRAKNALLKAEDGEADLEQLPLERVSTKTEDFSEISAEDFIVDWGGLVSRETDGEKKDRRKSGKKGEKAGKTGVIDIVFTLFKICWFDAAMYFVWKVVFAANTAVPFIDAHILPVILIGGSAFFIAYDLLIFRLRGSVNFLIEKYVGKK